MTEQETRLENIDDSKLGESAYRLYLAIRRLSDDDCVYRGRLGILSKFALIADSSIYHTMKKLQNAGLVSRRRLAQKNCEITVLRSWIE